VIVPKRDGLALSAAIIRLIDEPATRVRLSEAARISAHQYDIATFVAKMQRLYDLLHRVSRATHRRGVLGADLSFLTGKVPA
jgi:glycosyltransferase involved in cell wall biosynthesis